MWLESISKQLDLRDSREKAFESLILTFGRLQLKEDRALAKQTRLLAENRKLRNLACSKLIELDDEGAEARLRELQADRERLLLDAVAIESALRRASDDLARRSADLAATEQLAASLQLEVGRLRREVRGLANQRDRNVAEL
uniref:Uncharacterized protein n=1 Tax=Macrostomum lignano TaxID=282301 RepID=A0A1I8GE32_9PLAT